MSCRTNVTPAKSDSLVGANWDSLSGSFELPLYAIYECMHPEQNTVQHARKISSLTVFMKYFSLISAHMEDGVFK